MVYPKAFEEIMQGIVDRYKADNDIEQAHILADKLMCETLESLGYSTGVEVFRELPKWYA